jgi:hypothetical protein
MRETPPDPENDAPRPAPVPTPRLDALLARLARRLTAQVWLHGLGTALGATALWLGFIFLADWMLHLPAGIRVLHLLVLLGAPAVFLWRDLVRPLARRPDRTGRAVLVERAHPELKELFVSAVQLSGARGAEGDPALVAAVRREAEQRAAALDLSGVLDPRVPRTRFLVGTLCATACAALLVLNPHAAATFLARIAGGSTAWPQRTYLAIEIPLVSDRAQVRQDGDVLDVRVARGSDVPVIVRATGLFPDEITLHFTSGHKAVLASSGGGIYRTLLRSCQESVEFHATGGDDEDDVPTVRLTVLQPPDVAGVAVLVRPPAYSGLPQQLLHDSDVEVLAGSDLTVYMRPYPPDAHGVARVLPDDVVQELVPEPFPARDAAAGDPPIPGLAFDLRADHTLRYRFELEDASGLPNPDPGLFAVSVVDDRAPEVELLSPGRGEHDTVLGGALPLRVRVEDDFGITAVAWSATAGDDPGPPHPLTARPLDPAADTPAGAAASDGAARDGAARDGAARDGAARDGATRDGAARGAGARPRAAAFARERIDVAALVEGGVTEGQQLALTVSAQDNHQPEPATGTSAPARIRIVTVDEFLRRVQDRLGRVQTLATALSDLQIQKHRRTLDLLAGLESDDLPEGGHAAEYAAALTGQRRVLGDARAIAREVAAITEAVLYARIDERAEALLAFVDPLLAEQTSRGFDPAPWRALVAAYAGGQLGSAGLAGKLVEILGVALSISEEHAAGAADALARVQEARDLTVIHDELDGAAREQAAAVTGIESLLEMLAEWDNFQSVLSLTRDILSRQKNLADRTRQYAKEN